MQGQSIEPLYPYLPEAALKDECFYGIMSALDMLRTGRARERAAGQRYIEEILNEHFNKFYQVDGGSPRGRGKGNFLLSHDMDDIITIIDATEETQLKSIFAEGQGRVGAYLKGEFAGFVDLEEFEQAVAGTIRNRGQANERASQLIQTI